MVDIVITDAMKAITSCFLKIDFSRMTSGKLAPAELIIIAITGPRAIPFKISICEIGIMLDKRMYNGMPAMAATGMSHQASCPNHFVMNSVGTSP